MKTQSHIDKVKIAIVGVGGGGCNTINRIHTQGFPSEVKLIALMMINGDKS